MKRILFTSAAALALALPLMATSASAQGYGYGYGWGYNAQSSIDARQAAQERQIQSGVRSGQITRQEYRSLEAEQARIRSLEAAAKRDGYIDRNEAAQIRRAQNEASRHIYQESHDGDVRRSWYRRWW